MNFVFVLNLPNDAVELVGSKGVMSFSEAILYQQSPFQRSFWYLMKSDFS